MAFALARSAVEAVGRSRVGDWAANGRVLVLQAGRRRGLTIHLQPRPTPVQDAGRPLHEEADTGSEEEDDEMIVEEAGSEDGGQLL